MAKLEIWAGQALHMAGPKPQQAGVYDGSHRSVRRCAARWREETKVAPSDGGTAFVPLTFAPGEAFQFDFSHEDACNAGQPLRVKAAHIRLRAARAVHLRV